MTSRHGLVTERVRAIDATRGLLLAGMLLTPIGGDPDTYTWLRHSPWDGVTLSDLVFPGFLVTSGASLAFLLRPPVTADTGRRLVRRLVALLVLGVLYNAWGSTYGDLSVVRLTGVLQMIGLAGALAGAAVLALRRPRWIAGAALLVVAVHGVALAVAGGCDGEERCNPLHAIDVAVLGAEHTYRMGTVPFDPEGIAATVAASALVMAGYLAGERIRQGSSPAVVPALAAASLALVAAGLVLDLVQPVNKRLHTPAFSFVACGAALALLAAALVALDLPSRGQRWRRRAVMPLVVLGNNALVVFLAERVLTVVAANTRVGQVTLEARLLDAMPVGGASAHLAYSALLLAVVLAITSAMHVLRWRVVL